MKGNKTASERLNAKTRHRRKSERVVLQECCAKRTSRVERWQRPTYHSSFPAPSGPFTRISTGILAILNVCTSVLRKGCRRKRPHSQHNRVNQDKYSMGHMALFILMN